MKKLEQIQKSFCEAIFNDTSNFKDLIKSSDPDKRIQIYRVTVFENLLNALSLTFPGIWKLLGEDCSRGVGYTYIKNKENLPLSGCLDDWGSTFPDFLEKQKELKHLPYLKDYASYEWLKHSAYGAYSEKSFDLSDLEAIPEDQMESIGFSLIPSVFIFYSDFNLADIEEIIENPNAKALELNTLGSYAIIARPHDETLTFWVTQDLWLFIRYLYEGLNISQSFDKTCEKCPDFNLADAIHFLLSKELIFKIIKPD